MPGMAEEDGTPAWTLHDPAQNKFFRLGPLEIELLGLPLDQEPAKLAAQASGHIGRPVSPQDVMLFLNFLGRNNLLQAMGDAERKRLMEARRALHPGPFGWLLKNYLSLRIPLMNPDAFLGRTVRFLGWWFDPRLKWAIFALGAVGLLLAMQRWDEFLNTAVDFFTPRGLVLYGIAITLIKILHELGHGYTAKYYGCRVPAMGISIILFWPLLYTDTTDAWRLASRRARVEIDVAGMKAEIAVAALALLAWSLLPEGPLKGLCFLASTTSLFLTFAVNLNPLMRFDGYYLLSDWLGIENMQERATALSRWQWREWLFDLRLPPPEKPSRLLFLYAVAGWFYRLSLTLSIAAFIYAFFFKLLGLALFLYQLWQYIARPVLNEVKGMRPYLALMRQRRRRWLTLALTLSGVGLLVLPWQQELSIPAYVKARQMQPLYAPVAGQIREFSLSDGQQIASGQPLLDIVSTDLQFEIRQVAASNAVLAWQLQMQGLQPPWLQRGAVIEADLRSGRERQLSLERQAARGSIRTEQEGVLRDLLPGLKTGQYVAEGELLGRVVSQSEWEAVAYVTEADLERLRQGAEGRFVAADGSHKVGRLRIAEIEGVALREFDQPYLLSLFGGPVQAKRSQRGALEPLMAYFRVRLTVDFLADSGNEAHPRVIAGHAVIEGEGRSLVARAANALLRLLRREGGA